MRLLHALFKATTNDNLPLPTALSLTRGECYRYWSKLKNTTDPKQVAATVAELNRRTGRIGKDPWNLRQWTQILESHLYRKGLI